MVVFKKAVLLSSIGNLGKESLKFLETNSYNLFSCGSDKSSMNLRISVIQYLISTTKEFQNSRQLKMMI